MTEPRVTTKTELLAAIDRSWASLNSLLDRLTETQMTTLKDAQGWAVKDHIIHMTAWERSVVFFLQGKPRSEGLAIDEALYQKARRMILMRSSFESAKIFGYRMRWRHFVLSTLS